MHLIETHVPGWLPVHYFRPSWHEVEWLGHRVASRQLILGSGDQAGGRSWPEIAYEPPADMPFQLRVSFFMTLGIPHMRLSYLKAF